jgi:hypothetical protein
LEAAFEEGGALCTAEYCGTLALVLSDMGDTPLVISSHLLPLGISIFRTDILIKVSCAVKKNAATALRKHS